MRKHFAEELEELRERVLYMGGLVETAIQRGIRALSDREAEPAESVVREIEPEINRLEIEIDERAMRLFALQQPLAVDLRFLMAVVKINNNLERMGDLAVNICQSAAHLLHRPLAKPLVDWPWLGRQSAAMVRDALDALLSRNVELARRVLETDNAVDAARDEIFRELVRRMAADPELVEPALGLIFVARNLERIADHATNIAEEVIFWVEGIDVRHHQQEEAPDEAATGPSPS